METEKKEIGLYIHIPFCKSKCYYCDFFSISGDEILQERYIKCLEKELIHYSIENKILNKHKLEKRYFIKTIYIGGGTPSILDEIYIVNIIKTIKENFEIDKNAEITIEVNPGTVIMEKLKTYREIGINRLSIGLQASQDEMLKQIGRIHTFDQFLDTFNSARRVGFENINVDLMIGLPNQRIGDVEKSLNSVLHLKPEHISIYSLILEEGTRLYEQVNSSEVEMMSDALEREMYWKVRNTLDKYNYIQYEISNYARPGFESRHNLDCWNQKEYIGIGAAASSFIDNVRYSNIKDIKKYISNIECENYSKNFILEETLNKESKMKEFMMLGLRKLEGVNIIEFEKKFNENPIIKYSKDLEKLNKDGLITIIDDNIQLTNRGIDLANLVWEHFI